MDDPVGTDYEGTGDADSDTEDVTGGEMKTYKFEKSKRDFGSVVPVAGIETSQGFVARGDTIQIPEEEAAMLHKHGHTFKEVTDEEDSS